MRALKNDIREITVFSEGNSLDLNCWSNVPYLFTHTLEKRGIKVHRVNIYSSKYIRKTVWRYIVEPSLRRFCPGHVFTFDQTALNRWLIRRRIRRAIRKYPHSDVNLYLSYAYLEESPMPNVLFSDWTTEYVLAERLKRPPYRLEKRYLDIQRRNIGRADWVFGMFPDITRTMARLYHRDIRYLNRNVINNVYAGELAAESVIKAKQDAPVLLFVGGKTYLKGARALVEAFARLRAEYPALELHIVGLSQSDFKRLPEGVVCHGYLSKTVEAERQLYYDLLLKAKLFVNPMPQWGGYSATVEAMYFYTPVIVSAYPSFVEEFGGEPAFGAYLKTAAGSAGSPAAESELSASYIYTIYATVREMLQRPAYALMARKAHEAVADYTWDRYVEAFLTMLREPDKA